LGVSPADIVGKDVHSVLGTDRAADVLPSDRAVLEDKQAMEFAMEWPMADGTLRHLLVCKFPVTEASGNLLIGGVALRHHRTGARRRSAGRADDASCSRSSTAWATASRWRTRRAGS
jgi:hypothetical protein